MSASIPLTRKQFLAASAALLDLSLAGNAQVAQPAAGKPKILLAVAHPDDEYTFAATTYRLAKELGAIVDELIITNGEGGYRYATLAEVAYGIRIADEKVAREKLPDIRKQETLAAGRILGIRKHFFLDQTDGGVTLDPREGPERLWDTGAVLGFMKHALESESYDFVFVLLPTTETHGHHQAAAALVLKAVNSLSPSRRPVVLAGDPGISSKRVSKFRLTEGIGAHVESGAFEFDRKTAFGFHHALNYQIVVNWMIAEHKSQGLFQTDCNQHDVERFWILDTSSPQAAARTGELFDALTNRAR